MRLKVLAEDVNIVYVDKDRLPLETTTQDIQGALKCGSGTQQSERHLLKTVVLRLASKFGLVAVWFMHGNLLIP